MSSPADFRSVYNVLANNAQRFNPLGFGFQIGRSLIALAELLTLVLTSWDNLTADVLDRAPSVYCDGPRALSLFCLGGNEPREIGKWIAVVITLLVISGLLPRYVSVLHVWVALSINASISLPDGGESVANFATLFIAIIAVADARLLAWRVPAKLPGFRLRQVSYAASLALCAQMAGLYCESGLSKIAVPEWLDGSAMYFIIRDPYFGASGIAGDATRWLTNYPAGASLFTWGTILLECLIATFFLLPTVWKRYALTLVVVLHLGIAIVLGLWSFSFVMVGAAFVACYPPRSISLRASSSALEGGAEAPRTTGTILR